MDVQLMKMIIWPATAIISVGVGLGGLGMDVLKMLRVDPLRNFLEYVAGILGVLSLIGFFVYKQEIGCECMVVNVTWLLTALVALGIGLDAIGVNLIKTLNLQGSRKVLQFLAGALGIYSLIGYFKNV
jgi:hypothetical protein